MLDIYICEDEQNHLDTITKNVNHVVMIDEPDMQIVLATKNPHEILEHLKENRSYNVYILDVDLKSDINGLALATKIRKLDPRGYIIFVTTHSEMSYMTFQYKVEAFDFIPKDDAMYERKIQEAIRMVYERHCSSSLQKNVFTMKHKGNTIVEDYENILLFEASETPHMVYMITKERQLKFKSSLKELEKNLEERFFRCSSANIINIDKVKNFDKKTRTVELENGEECVVSTRNVNELKRRLENQK